jgi:hypothetical protein
MLRIGAKTGEKKEKKRKEKGERREKVNESFV